MPRNEHTQWVINILRVQKMGETNPLESETFRVSNKRINAICKHSKTPKVVILFKLNALFTWTKVQNNPTDV